jgi:hypothetical protein
MSFVSDERNLATIQGELRARKVESTNLWDVFFDLIILDAFEGLTFGKIFSIIRSKPIP